MIAILKLSGRTLAIKAKGPEERLALLELLAYDLELKGSTGSRK
jgi:hypothetical protein